MFQRLFRVAGLVALVVVTTATASYGQGKWGPYDRGRSLLKAKQYQEAIASFEKALALDPVPGAHQKVEMADEDYFPQYYLFVAYLGLKNPAKARSYFDQRGEVNGTDPAKEYPPAKYEQDSIALETEAKNLPKFEALVAQAGTAAQDDAKLGEAEQAYLDAQRLLPAVFTQRGLEAKLRDVRSRKAIVEAAARKLAEFNTDVARFRDKSGAGQYGDAADALTAAKTLDSVEFAKRNLQTELDGAIQARDAQKDLLDRTGKIRDALGKDQFDAALTECSEVQRRHPKEYDDKSTNLQSQCDKAKAGKANVDNFRGAVTAAQALLVRARTDLTEKSYGDAVDAFTAIQTRYSTLFTAEMKSSLIEATAGKQRIADFEVTANAAAALVAGKKYKDAATTYTNLSTGKSKDLDDARHLKDGLDRVNQAMAEFAADVDKAKKIQPPAFDEAIAAYDAADKVWPDEFERLGLAAGRKAMEDARNKAGGEKRAVAIIDEADAAESRGEHEKALADLDRVPKDSAVFANVAPKAAAIRRKWAQQDVDQAVSSLKQEETENGMNLLLAAEKMQAALDAPLRAKLHGYLGVAYSYSKNDAQATAQFKQALSIQKTFDLDRTWVRTNTLKLFDAAK